MIVEVPSTAAERSALAALSRLRRSGSPPAFDAYGVVDWSARSRPALGRDTVWLALLCWHGDRPTLETANCATRASLVAALEERLRGPLAGQRVLLGFDFPLGYPRGFARALGHAGPPADAWRAVWDRLLDQIHDDASNSNDRFEVAAALNRELSGGFGPFFGRPATAPDAVARHLSARQAGFFTYPVRCRCGAELARLRAADVAAKAASSPWFLYGGANAVGGQALLGIPRLARLRDDFPGARVWPFETGATPPPAHVPVVLAEVYPSMFHRRRPGPEVHDRLQVTATALALARLDAEGSLRSLFAAPPADGAVLNEEGWVLGAA